VGGLVVPGGPEELLPSQLTRTTGE
jgi:hypothetical protein